MIISSFTQIEADYLELVCNFTEEENTLFLLRLKNVPLEECAERMHRSIDSVKKISKRINHKIQESI